MVSTVTWFISGSAASSAFSHSSSWVAILPEAWVGAAGVVSNRLATLCGWVAAAASGASAGFGAGAAGARGAAPAWLGCSSLRMMFAMRSVALSVDFARGCSVTVRLVESVCTLRKIAAMRSLLSTG